jgi:hypothetical protein
MPTLAPIVVDTLISESHKKKSYEDINQDKMEALEARIRATEEVYLYDPI